MLVTGNQLRAARVLAGMDQAALAKASGVNVNTISSMEMRGREKLRSGVDTVAAIAVALQDAGVECVLNRSGIGVMLRPPTTQPEGSPE